MRLDLDDPATLSAARIVLAQHAHDLLRDLRQLRSEEIEEVTTFALAIQVRAFKGDAAEVMEWLAQLAPLRTAYQIRARVQKMQRAPGGQA